MTGPRVVATLLAICVFAPVLAGARSGRRPKRAPVSDRSPDRQHTVTVTAAGRARVDGRAVQSGEGRVVGRPVWRGDSRALAYLQRTPYGVRLVVLQDLTTRRPLVWQLPPAADALRRVMWVGKRRVGVGARALVPRMVISWSTSTRLLF